MQNIDEGESIPMPPVAQNIMLRVISFIINKSFVLVFLPIISEAYNIYIAQEIIFTRDTLFNLLFLVFILIFYFRSRKNALLNLERYMKDKKFNLNGARVIKIGFGKENPEKNFEK